MEFRLNNNIYQYDKNIVCKIIEKIEETTESNIDITIFQGIPKFEKMALIILSFKINS